MGIRQLLKHLGRRLAGSQGALQFHGHFDHTFAAIDVHDYGDAIATRNLMPQGDGTHAMMVGKDLQAGASAHAGDSVTVVMDIDRSERVVEVPVELKRALAASKPAAKMFESLSYSHRKEFADWVGSAKQADTRLARAAKAVPLVLARKHCR